MKRFIGKFRMGLAAKKTTLDILTDYPTETIIK